MLRDGGILVDGRWFGRDSSPVERARYHAAFLVRQERNRRRRERRKASAAASRDRPPRRILSQAPGALEANRRPFERRKCQRRSTVAACPTADEIRTAWRFRNGSPANRVRLGALLMDLECHVDNSLVWNRIGGRLAIVGRRGGLRGWIRGNCPELEPHYKTLQRVKGVAKRLRQELDLLDPVPLSALMDRSLGAEALASAEVRVQPRAADPGPVRTRYPWERSELHFDANGRPYLANENYRLARREIPRETVERIPALRSLLASLLILIGKGNRTIENYADADGVRVEEAASGGILKEFGGMFAYIGRHPEFLADAGRQLARDVAKGVAEVLLPERTLKRMADGERVGVGRVALDFAEAYMRFYDASLVCHWNRVPRSETDT